MTFQKGDLGQQLAAQASITYPQFRQYLAQHQPGTVNTAEAEALWRKLPDSRRYLGARKLMQYQPRDRLS